ncbi:MAG TPA: hypothetical protein VGC27_00425, partial [Rhizomicrobium sp.]
MQPDIADGANFKTTTLGCGRGRGLFSPPKKAEDRAFPAKGIAMKQTRRAFLATAAALSAA